MSSLASRRSQATPPRWRPAVPSSSAYCCSPASPRSGPRTSPPPRSRRSSAQLVADRGSAKSNLACVNVVVADVLGLRSPDNRQTVGQLAAVLRAEYVCSDPLARKGLVTPARQIGHTGKSIRPNLDVAAGNSDAIQRQVGVKSGHLIVAIKIEKNSSILDFAHIDIGGDAIPPLQHRWPHFVRGCARSDCELNEIFTLKIRSDDHPGRSRDGPQCSRASYGQPLMKALRPERGEYSPAPGTTRTIEKIKRRLPKHIMRKQETEMLRSSW
ncbi:FAD-binding protein [Bradyrhizobium sp. USDA 10063]